MMADGSTDSEDHVDVIFGGWRGLCLGRDDLFLWFVCVVSAPLK